MTSAPHQTAPSRSLAAVPSQGRGGRFARGPAIARALVGAGLAVGVAGLGAACGDVGEPVEDAPPPSVGCDPTARFGRIVVLSALGGNGGLHPRLSADELTIYFYSSLGSIDLWSARRSSVAEPFGAPFPLSAVSSAQEDYDPMLSPDGLTLWFASRRDATTGTDGARLYVATRPSGLAELGAPALAATVNAPDRWQADAQPFLTADHAELWFSSNRGGGVGGYDLWRAQWTGASFAPPVVVAGLSSGVDDWTPTLSADRRTIYFSSNRAARGGGFEIWRAHRTAVEDGFSEPVLVEELNTPSNDFATWLSADNCRLYGSSRDLDGQTRIFLATREP